MKSEFDQICESLGVMRNTTKMFYPRNLKLSEKFLHAFKEEIGKQKRIFSETSGGKSFQPQGERILKALRFHLHEYNKTRVSKKPIEETPKPEIVEKPLFRNMVLTKNAIRQRM